MASRAPDGLSLAGEFPPADREQWRALVDGVLKGRPFDKVLVTTLYDGIDLQPLYTADDVATGEERLGLPGAAPFVRGSSAARTTWDVRQHHIVADGRSAETANEAILADLERGATSIWLRCAPGLLDAALDGVYLDLAAVVLDAGPDYHAGAEALVELWAARGVAPSAALGGFGADPLTLGLPLDPAVALAVRASAEFPGVRAITVDATSYHDAGGSDVDELGAALAAGVGYLRALTDAGLDIHQASSQIEFRYAASADQFSTIAKLRAARRLWARVTELSGGAQPQRQHAVTSSAMMTRRDPWVNMLRTTVACFGAAVGGAEAITVQPFDAAIGLPDELGHRVARNTQALLLDESNLARVSDPAGGSWYVEHLSDQMARNAWSWFRDIERAGGIATALDAGIVTERLASTWSARSQNLAKRKDPLTGVSEFPDIAETPVVREPAPEPPAGRLPRHRYAEPYEALRDRADSARVRPTVFLANLGPVATHTARSTFAKNFFEAGGIAALGNDGFDSPVAASSAFTDSGAAIACICSSDAVYDERAEAAAVALRAAGARRIYIAGRRDTDGVDEQIFAGCDAIAVLSRALDAALVEGA